MFDWFKRRRRRKVAETPLPVTWRPILETGAPFFRALSAERQARLLELLQLFLAEKPIVAAGGLELTEEMRVLVGASAVRLILDLDLDHYQRLTEIVLYPYDAIVDPSGDDHLLGLAHRHGAVVLSWPSVQAGLRAPHDGRDTAVHEFAHALDLADGVFDGAPALRAREDYGPWAKHLGQAYDALVEGDRNLLQVLRPYGGTNPVEFFAVATEVFFERPGALRKRAPDLYADLARFYGREEDGA